MPKGFTPEELEAMRLADEEIERDFRITNEDLRESRALDRLAVFDKKDKKEQKVAAQQKAWYEANREKVAAQQKAYREANRERISENRRRKYREHHSADQASL